MHKQEPIALEEMPTDERGRPLRKRHHFGPLAYRQRQRLENPVTRRRQPVPGMGQVRFSLDRYCQRMGYVNKDGRPNRALVQRMTGVSDDALFYMLRYPETIGQIHFRTLARLCHGLQCQPGDILEYTRLEDSGAPISEQYKVAPGLGLEEDRE